LPKDQFEHREWVALAYARDWALFRGQMPDPELVDEFNRLYSESERRSLLALMTTMYFTNRFNNTFGRPLQLPQAYGSQAGPLPADRPEPK
jgi:hypothetical protein